MLRPWRLLAVVALAALPASAAVGPQDAHGYRWIDDREPGHEFIDPEYDNATPLPLVGSASAPIALPFVMTLYGRPYDHAEATADGRVVLRWLGAERWIPSEDGKSMYMRRSAARDDVAVLDVFAGVRPGRDAMLVYSHAPTQVSFRWVSFEQSPREPVTFEAQLRADGRVRYQYWAMRNYLIGPNYGRLGRIALNDPTGGPGIVVLDAGQPAQGFDLRSGGIVEFPGDPGGDGPGPRDTYDVQCPPNWGLPSDFANWCDRVNAGLDGDPATPDNDPACLANVADGTHAPCNLGVATQWLFREGNDFCLDCPYTFYVRVDCGTDMHMPTNDVEAMQVQITDMNTGLPRVITAENECARRRDAGDPYEYCDACTQLGAIVPKDDPIGPPVNKPAGLCEAHPAIGGPIFFPVIECAAYRETGTTVAWGAPLDQTNPDTDGSGFIEQDEMDTPPCETCDTSSAPPCTCGQDTAANKLTEEQVIDVILYGSPTLTGVFRLDILSGGLEWQLYTNCDGTEFAQYPIYDRCDRALAEYNPLPQLFLSDDPSLGYGLRVDDTSGCPGTLAVSVTLCNTGGAPTASAPFTIRFLDSAGNPVAVPFEGDIATATNCVRNAGLPLDSDECRTCSFDVAPNVAGANAVLEVDRNFAVAECSEDPTAVRCTLTAGSRGQTLPVCAAACLSTANLAVTGSPFCVNVPVRLDATRSIMSGCSGTPEYRYEQFDSATSSYVLIPGADWSSSPTFDWRGMASGTYRVRVLARCSTDTTCVGTSSTVTFEVLVDTDLDGISDACNDNCPTINNPLQEDADRDFDGDACDNCPAKFNPSQDNSDSDVLGDECDNCRFDVNPGQENADGDTYGNACDNCTNVVNDQFVDLDGDGAPDPLAYGEVPQSDLDTDDVGDLCDNCPFTANSGNPVARDCNGDSDTTDPGEGAGEQCDQDADGVGDTCDNCRTTANPRNDLVAGFDCNGDGTIRNGPGEEIFGEAWLTQCDQDADGVGDACDNCPARANASQADSDEDPPGSGTLRPDGVGNACDNCPFAYNPPNTVRTDCNGDGDTTDADEGIGDQCNVCTGCAFGPPEVLAGVGGFGHLSIEKSMQTAAVFITSRDSGAGADYTVELFGVPITPGLLEHFNVYRGTLASLAQDLPTTDPAHYDHVGNLAEGCTVTPLTERTEVRGAPFVRTARGIYDAEAIVAGAPDFYYLVVGACAGDGGASVDGEYGYASPDGVSRTQPIPPSTSPCP